MNQFGKHCGVLNLEEFVEALPDKLNLQIGEYGVRLSGGQRQRIGIARALFADLDIIVGGYFETLF